MNADRALRLVDTHAHLDDPAFDADRDEVIAGARAAGIERVVNVGYRPARWESTVALARRHPNVAVMFGLHPQHAAGFTDETLERLADALVQDGAVAVGEIGFDFFRDGPDAASQRRAFHAQVRLARQIGLPIVIHQRSAETELIEALADHPDLPAVILHSFEGSLRLARFGLDRGYLFGVGGLATRAGSTELRDVLAKVPLESIVLETDSPYLSPASSKLRRNEPRQLVAIADRLAPLWSATLSELAEVTTRTAEAVFRLDLPVSWVDGGAS